MSLYCGKQIQPPLWGIEPRSHEWQAGILTTFLPRMFQIWKQCFFICDKNVYKVCWIMEITGRYWYFFQTTFINVTHHILFISKLRKSDRTSRVTQRKRAGPITQRSVDQNHSLLCINHLTFESNNFKWKVIMKFFFFLVLCLYNHPPIGQLVELRTVVAALAGILTSRDQIWTGGQHFCKKIINK